MQVKCDFCGEMTQKPPRQVRLWKHHFCDKFCYTAWLKKFNVKISEYSDWSAQKKLREFAKKREQLLKQY